MTPQRLAEERAGRWAGGRAGGRMGRWAGGQDGGWTSASRRAGEWVFLLVVRRTYTAAGRQISGKICIPRTAWKSIESFHEVHTAVAAIRPLARTAASEAAAASAEAACTVSPAIRVYMCVLLGRRRVDRRTDRRSVDQRPSSAADVSTGADLRTDGSSVSLPPQDVHRPPSLDSSVVAAAGRSVGGGSTELRLL